MAGWFGAYWAVAQSLGLRPKPEFLVGFGGFAAKTNQKNPRGGEAAPNPIPAYAGTEADVATALWCVLGCWPSSVQHQFVARVKAMISSAPGG
jgi:hypothetical protein